jgi:hypothetical protein
MAASGLGVSPELTRGVDWTSPSKDEGTAPDMPNLKSYHEPLPPQRWQKYAPPSRRMANL